MRMRSVSLVVAVVLLLGAGAPGSAAGAGSDRTGTGSAGSAGLFTAAELTAIAPEGTALVAVFNVARWPAVERACPLRAGDFDILAMLNVEKAAVPAVAAVLKGRDHFALVFRTRGESGPVMRKMLNMASGGGKRSRKIRSGVYLCGYEGEKNIVARLSERLVLWSMADDAKGSLGLGIIRSYEQARRSARAPAESVTRLVAASRGSFLAWSLIAPTRLDNDGIGIRQRDFRTSGLATVEGRAFLRGSEWREEVVCRFPTPAKARAFLARSRGEEAIERELLDAFILPLQYLVKREAGRRAPRQTPDRVWVEGSTVRAARAVSFARTKGTTKKKKGR